ncbi:MAG: hypothetical protein A3B90_00575 [Candidatus Magasanikbacteria bacterium RIFCSPHIGHO2_02_FULL_41_13]|uniref:Uncharacterized protein n=1 Tax=Candidatus Magasanikbacteria bacterium RIFCSPHIGHO2_02_FULL_41_13 TaxID=1798676 RepID=A0A1F6M651_9BACT|nr:MAG: hypothetical protein A3B90_00575 [Candidatus Magasanikbacteria bacterium RIFCSPHIGHO2_02_FULL_41_13]
MKKNIFIVFLLVVIIGILAINFKFNKQEKTSLPEYVMCPSEAKICPDGSTVIRMGSYCEFAECPSSSKVVSSVDQENAKIEGKHLVYFRGVKQDGLSAIVTLDPITMFSGDEATAAAMQDTKCSKAKVITCAPSLNNNFYIRNLSNETQNLTVTLSTDVYLESASDTTELKKVGILELKKISETWPLERLSITPFWVTARDEKVSKIEQQYIP